MTILPRRVMTVALAAALVVIAVNYWPTFQTIAAKWSDDATYSHGLLVLPIVVWLVWRRRDALQHTELRPSGWGLPALLVCAAAWVVARGTGILVLEQFAALAMVPAAVLAVAGAGMVRVLGFPLAFLMLAVPFGKGLVPWLMQVTADISMLGLRLTGIPAYRNAMFITIPEGDFEVARACSGLNYVTTGFVLGTLYAYLTYRSWFKRLAFIVASIIVPIAANGVRAYLTIAVAHWTDMRYGTGEDHIVLGRVLFVIVMLGLFWVGLRWRDPDGLGEQQAVPQNAMRGTSLWPRGVAILVGTFLLLATPPVYLRAATTHGRGDPSDAAGKLAWPVGREDWHGPQDDPRAWRPLYSGAVAEQRASYDSPQGRVEAYVGLYGIGVSAGAEMINYSNRIHANEDRSLIPEQDVQVALRAGQLTVRETLVTEPAPRLVWYWYQVGQHRFLRGYSVKAREALDFLTQQATDERIVTLAIVVDGTDEQSARAALTAFVRAHAGCVTSGFAAEACR